MQYQYLKFNLIMICFRLDYKNMDFLAICRYLNALLGIVTCDREQSSKHMVCLDAKIECQPKWNCVGLKQIYNPISKSTI